MNEPDVEPLASLLEALHAALLRYVVLPSAEATDAVALWIAATHGQAAWEHAPRLVIKAPEKRCGKSRLLDVIEATAYAPLMSVQASAASIYRAIGAAGAGALTLLVDEADALFGAKAAADHEDLRSLLNAGHQRNRRVPRWNANANRLEQLDTFAMAALAGIGSMPDTIEDRAVVVPMRRRAAGEKVAPFRHRRDAVQLHDVRGRLTLSLRALLGDLVEAEPGMPVEDRAADTWEPLVAVADAAGGDWPERARAAALALTSAAETSTESSTQHRLLSDCRTVLLGTGGIPTSQLLDALRKLPEAGWDTYGPSGLTGKRLADLLARYGIRPSGTPQRWPSGVQARGYRTGDFEDAWTRYLPPQAHEPARYPSHPYQPSPERVGAGQNLLDLGTDFASGTDQSVPGPQSVPLPKPPVTSGNALAATVGTDGTGTPCGVCGQHVGDLRAAYGKTTCREHDAAEGAA